MRRRATSETSAHWSKDFVEHLRTVHIGLIALSAAIILVVLSSKPYNRANALREIEEIEQLQREWSPGWLWTAGEVLPLFVVTKADGTSDWQNEDLVAVPSSIDAGTFGVTGTEILGTIHWKDQSTLLCRFVFPERAWRDLAAGPNGSDPLDWNVDRFPKKISDFRRWWNALSQPHKVLFPAFILRKSDLDLNETGGYVEVDVHHQNTLSQAAIPVKLNLREENGPGQLLRLTYFGVAPNFKSTNIKFSVATGSEVTVTQAMLQKIFKNWEPGPFDNTFLDLAQAASGLDDLELGDVRKSISDELAKGTEVFEAFGIKFPADQVTFGGIVFLLSVQLYFLVHLAQLRDRLRADDPGWDVPWVGMYTGIGARAMLFATVIIVPCLAVLLLDVHSAVLLTSGIRGQGDTMYAIFRKASWWTELQLLGLALAFFLTATLSFLCWRNRPQLKNETAPAQLFE